MLTSRLFRTTMAAFSTLLIVAFLLAWNVVWSAAPAQANDEPADESGRMVMVLDSSGSMKEPASGGQSKIAAAKSALGQVIGSLPENQAVGLRVYGAKVFSRDQPGACQDSQLVVPVETGNRSDLRSAVKTYRPFGETPIGYALQEAGKDLGNEGQRTIVLVSDGEPTCDPDPCEVARDLAKQGVNLKIDVVGLDVDGSARKKLQCIAAAGHGTYYDASGAADLAASLEKLATRAFRPFAFSGTPVTGTLAPEGAPALEAGEQYLDKVGEAGQPVHYSIERQIPGSTLSVGATARPNAPRGQMQVTITAPDGTECSRSFATSHEMTITQGIVTSGANSYNEGVPACQQADSLLVTVEETSFSDDITDSPLEIVAAEEPPAENIASLPPAAEDPGEATAWKPGAGKAGAVAGTAFADAPLIEPGDYKGALLPGEIQFFKVDVDWGQQLQAQFHTDTPNATLADALGQVTGANVLLYGPDRADIADTRFLVDDTEPTTEPAQAAQVRYRNREQSGTEIAAASRAGEYYVGVSLDEKDGPSFLVPFTLSVKTAGTTQGAPVYAEPSDAASQPTAEPSDAASQPTDEPSDDQSDQENAAGSNDGGGAGMVVGALGLLALAGAGYLVYRSRATST